LKLLGATGNSAILTWKHEKKRAPVTGDLVGVRIQPDMAKKIDDWRRRQDDLPGRPEAIRRRVEQALDDQPKKRKGDG
jgi:hypothetical protein